MKTWLDIFQLRSIIYVALFIQSALLMQTAIATTGPRTVSEVVSIYMQAIAEKDAGNIRRAIAILEPLIPVAENLIGNQSADTATLLYSLADLYESVGLHHKAEHIYKRCFSMFEAAPAEHNYERLLLLRRLAGVHDKMGQREQAERNFRRALAFSRFKPGEGQINVSMSLIDLGNFYRRGQAWNQAEVYFLEKYKKNNRYHPCISRQKTGAWI